MEQYIILTFSANAPSITKERRSSFLMSAISGKLGMRDSPRHHPMGFLSKADVPSSATSTRP